jgi:kumamolisin
MKQSTRSVRVSLWRELSGAIGAGVLLCLVALPALAEPRPLLTQHARAEVLRGEAAFVRHLPADQTLRLNIALPLRNEAELNDLVQRLKDSESPSYRQFLTVQEFTERFGPARQDYDAVVRFAQENGLTVTRLSENRHLVDVEGSVSAIEKAFHVTMAVYQHPTENRTFFAPDREPTADLPFALWHITGLDNFSIPHPASLARNESHTSNATGSGPGGQFIGSDFRAAYYGGSKLNGSGQSLGLLEFAGYNIKDVNTYFSKVKQKRTVTVKGVSTDGSSLSCTGKCDDGEQVIDIEVAISMAPRMKDLYVYVSDTSDVSIFNRMATDNLAKQLSCSWVWAPEDQLSDEPIFLEFAVQGQTLFAASGDSGAYNSKNHTYPAEDPLVVAVGGTDLTTNGAGGSWKSETAWSGSGGGISPDKIGIPTYQSTKGVITKANKGSTKYRNLPDVAAEANTDNYVCLDGTCQSGWGGTSFAAPRWAGYLALVNQQSVSKGKGTVGFINTTLYTLGLGSKHATEFHDITSGSNGTYSCTKGYDLVTGWGSPKSMGLINALAP